MTSWGLKIRPLLPNQRGVGLIEVLITLVVLAIGLLGIAALQLLSKRTNFEAAERTIATQLAYDILERMRANPTALQTYAGTSDSAAPVLGYQSAVFTAEPTPNCSGSATACSPIALATHDLWEWEQKLLGAQEVTTDGGQAGGLVMPKACIATNVAAGVADRSGRYSVAIVWRGNTEISDPVNPVSPAPAFDPYACGRDTGALGTGLYDGATVKNSRRRILVLDAYVSQQ
jgi:type IV pilus assembly protein PilV